MPAVLLLTLALGLAAPADDVRSLAEAVERLDDPTPAARRDARRRLLVTRPSALIAAMPDLTRLAAELSPLQREGLIEAARHAFARRAMTDPMNTDDLGGFMGVRLGPGQLARGRDLYDGAIIYGTVIGNVAHAHFRPGDLVVGIEANNRELAIDGTDALRNTVVGIPPGTTAVFTVERDGQQRRIEIKLDPRPAGIENNLADFIRQDAINQADAFAEAQILPRTREPQVIRTGP